MGSHKKTTGSGSAALQFKAKMNAEEILNAVSSGDDDDNEEVDQMAAE